MFLRTGLNLYSISILLSLKPYWMPRIHEVIQIQPQTDFNLKRNEEKTMDQSDKVCERLGSVLYSSGILCSFPETQVHIRSTLYPVLHLSCPESNLPQCQMRPITSSTSQSFPATEPTSNSLIENKAWRKVISSSQLLSATLISFFVFGSAL